MHFPFCFFPLFSSFFIPIIFALALPSPLADISAASLKERDVPDSRDIQFTYVNYRTVDDQGDPLPPPQYTIDFIEMAFEEARALASATSFIPASNIHYIRYFGRNADAIHSEVMAHYDRIAAMDSSRLTSLPGDWRIEIRDLPQGAPGTAMVAWIQGTNTFEIYPAFFDRTNLHGGFRGQGMLFSEAALSGTPGHHEFNALTALTRTATMALMHEMSHRFSVQQLDGIRSIHDQLFPASNMFPTPQIWVAPEDGGNGPEDTPIDSSDQWSIWYMIDDPWIESFRSADSGDTALLNYLVPANPQGAVQVYGARRQMHSAAMRRGSILAALTADAYTNLAASWVTDYSPPNEPWHVPSTATHDTAFVREHPLLNLLFPWLQTANLKKLVMALRRLIDLSGGPVVSPHG